MAYGRIARKILHVLNLPAHRGRWLDTRAIANAVYETEWASQNEAASVRQSLRKLADRGDVYRSGFFAEWRLAGSLEVEPPAMYRHLMAALQASPRALPPD